MCLQPVDVLRPVGGCDGLIGDVLLGVAAKRFAGLGLRRRHCCVVNSVDDCEMMGVVSVSN